MRRIVRCRPVQISPAPAVRAPQPHVWESSKSWLNSLGRQTVQHHALVDAARLAILDVTSEAKYRLFLERIYGFEAAVECQVSGVRGLEVALYGARARLARLHQDLVVLGHDASAIAALAQPTVTVQHSSDALGWLFVIERHVLLAGLIRRVVATQAPALARATGYFATHT